MLTQVSTNTEKNEWGVKSTDYKKKFPKNIAQSKQSEFPTMEFLRENSSWAGRGGLWGNILGVWECNIPMH